MADYIDRESLMTGFRTRVWRSNHSDFAKPPQWNDAVEIVENMPSAHVRLVNHGKWKTLEKTETYEKCECTICGVEMYYSAGHEKFGQTAERICEVSEMVDYIDREAFITEERKRYCFDCDRRKGIKNGKMRFCYAVGEAPCRSCLLDDALDDAKNFPAADVVPVVRCKDCKYWVENGICKALDVGYGELLVPSKFFCARGERKCE